MSGTCWLYSTEAGDARDADGDRPFFRAGIRTEPGAPASPIGFTEQLVGNLAPYLNSPLGGGIPGEVTSSGVSVKLACDVPSRGVKDIVAGAVSIPGTVARSGPGHQIPEWGAPSPGFRIRSWRRRWTTTSGPRPAASP